MKTKDKQDEQQRHAQRDALIGKVFNGLLRMGFTFDKAYIFVGRIWGLGERKVREIVRRNAFSALNADDLSVFLVILRLTCKNVCWYDFCGTFPYG